MDSLQKARSEEYEDHISVGVNKITHLKRVLYFAMGVATFILLIQVAKGVWGGSDTLRYESELSGHWESFNKQQIIVNQAKETQIQIKGSIISSMIDTANSKLSDETKKKEKDQAEIARLGVKAECLRLVYNQKNYANVDLEKVCNKEPVITLEEDFITE